MAQLIKRRAKVKSSVHMNTLLQRMRGILKANNELYFNMLIQKNVKKIMTKYMYF